MPSVIEIRYVAYGVPDLAAERAFFGEKWGLDEVGEDRGTLYFAARGQDEHHVLRLRHAPERRVDAIGLAAATAGEVDGLHTKVIAAGCRIISAPHPLASLGGGYGFRFFSPDGLPFEISSDVARRAGAPGEHWNDLPQKISHIVLHSPDHHAATQFFVNVLGFHLSDWLGDFMAFLRCNEWHHRVAFLPGPACLNHVAYDMASVDGMMRAVGRLKAEGVPIAWGPGRHTAGNNTFGYYVTPNGIAVEYTADLERVDEATWQPQVHTPGPGIIDRWGVGVGGPHTMPHPVVDPALFQAAEA